MRRHVGQLRADRAEADDAEALAGKLGADELALALFDGLRHVFFAGERLRPVDTVDDLAGGEQQRTEREFLHRARVRARRVEDHNAVFTAAVDRDVVHTRTRARDGKQLFAESHVVQRRRTHHDRVGIFHVFAHDVLVFIELIRPAGRDLVH